MKVIAKDTEIIHHCSRYTFNQIYFLNMLYTVNMIINLPFKYISYQYVYINKYIDLFLYYFQNILIYINTYMFI